MARGTRSGAKRSPEADAEDDADGTTTTTRQTRSTRSSEQPEDSSKPPSPKKSKTEEDEKGKKEEDDAVDASKASAAAATQPKKSPPSSPSNKKRPTSSETEESENKRTRRGKKDKEADVAATKDATSTDADDGDKAKPDSEKDAQQEQEDTQNKEEDTKDTADKKDTANDATGDDDDEKKAPPASVDEKAKEDTPAGDEQKPPGKEEKPPASVEEPKPPAKSKEDIEEEKHGQAQQKFNEAWPDMIKELIKFKEEFGHVEVPILGDCDLKYYELSKWVGKLRTQMKNYEERQHPTANKVQEIAGAASLLAGRATAAAALAPPTTATNSNPPPPKSLLDESKIKELTDIGFTFKYKRGLKRKTKEEEAEQFDKFCNLLEDFKEKGKSIKSHTQLQGWIAKQRKQYVEYQAIRQSTLTEERIERLTKAGMNWNPKQTQTWEQRALAWKEFKEKTGKDPKRYSEDGLGKWVTEQRSKYKRYQKGQSTNLTSDQIQTLKDWGFSFEGAIKQPENKAKPASWEERFKQLEEWKEEHGHCIVPQHFPILGQWVHGVRSQYRKFKEGKKCNMTKDKIDKLENIGFVFYTGKGGGARTPESVARRLENEKKAKEDGTSPKKSAKKVTSAKTDASSKTNIKEEESKGEEAKESKGEEAKESKGDEAKESKGEEKEPDKEGKEPDTEEDIVVEETVTV